MTTLEMMNKMREITLGGVFTLADFEGVVGVTGEEAKKLLGMVLLDCYAVSVSGGFKVLHGKERTKAIAEKIKICEENINKWYIMHKHLKKL